MKGLARLDQPFFIIEVRISGPPEAGTLLNPAHERTTPGISKVLRPGGAGFTPEGRALAYGSGGAEPQYYIYQSLYIM